MGCRVVDDLSQSELCRYMLRDAGRENGLIVAKIARETGGRFGFHALGLPCKGRTYKDALPEIRKVCMEDTKKYMARGGSMDLSSMASMGAYASTGAAPPTQSVAAAPTMTATVPAPQTFPAASPPAQSVVAQ